MLIIVRVTAGEKIVGECFEVKKTMESPNDITLHKIQRVESTCMFVSQWNFIQYYLYSIFYTVISIQYTVLSLHQFDSKHKVE